MGIFSVSESCAVHGEHYDAFPLNGFNEATVVVLGVLAELASVVDVVALTRLWIDQEGRSEAVLNFTDELGAYVSLVYSV